jgi:hypothetical protein
MYIFYLFFSFLSPDGRPRRQIQCITAQTGPESTARVHSQSLAAVSIYIIFTEGQVSSFLKVYSIEFRTAAAWTKPVLQSPMTMEL